MSPTEKPLFPDTLSLEDRAALAIHSLIGIINPDNGYLPLMHADLTARPTFLEHSCWDYGCHVGRFIEAMFLARNMTGSTYGEDVEKKVQDLLFTFFKEDGLSYRPVGFYTQGYANFHDQTHVLAALTVWYMLTGEQRIKEAADRLCAGMKKISRKAKDFWYLPCVEYAETGWPLLDALYMGTATDPAHVNARMINQLTKYYQVTGSIDALELAENYAAQLVKYSAAYNPDGSFNGKMEFRNGHFHSRMVSLAALTKFAAFTGNASYLNWSKKIYDWALSQSTTFGWTPGGMEKNKSYLHETCTITDFIEVGILLAQNGYPEYWNVAERFVRNHLAESQLLNVDWITQTDDTSMDIPGRRSYYRVADRMLGGFAGYAAPNDFVCEYGHRGGHSVDIQMCCLASGTRGLFLAWSNIVTEKAGRVSVNLLLNRASHWLDVRSYMPHEGRIELEINEDIPELLVRIPDWVPFDAISLKKEHAGDVTEKTADTWLDRHIKAGPCMKGDKVT
ncbi:MAG TPA: beta-L-arabinofuranosidase domain-containing protein, partial [Clostridia bacterium]